MITVTSGSRLHFGLLQLPGNGISESIWEKRSFGGIGLMLHEPSIHVTIQQASEWSGSGPFHERAIEIAQRLLTQCNDPRIEKCAFQIDLEATATHHSGLGVGTQLAMSVGYGISQLLNLNLLNEALALRVERGRRSAIGVHGFESGGMIVDAGKRAGQSLGTALARYPFPQEWPVVLACPRNPSRWHGEREKQAFDRARDVENLRKTTEKLSRLLLLGVLPAFVERDYLAFAESLYEYNRVAGEPFLAEQEGHYCCPETTGLIEMIRANGIAGCGQSSWGPTVFAICPDTSQARHLKELLATRGPELELLLITTAANTNCTERIRTPSSVSRSKNNLDQPYQENVGTQHQQATSDNTIGRSQPHPF